MDSGRHSDERFDVGGILLDRPFKIRRFGHFGYNCDDIDAMVEFYGDGLGMRISDRSDRLSSRQSPELQASLRDSERFLHFMRYGTEHHQFVLIAAKLWAAVDPGAADRSINQITWQVGSLREVVDASAWIAEQGGTVLRAGRDMPGSNWHTYIADADGHVHELYYGMEQIGWDGLSKPRAMWERDGAVAAPELPHAAEATEVGAAADAGVDLSGGWRWGSRDVASYDVDGILLARPFKVVSLGPVSLYVDDLDTAVAFHRAILGFEVRRRVDWEGHRGVLMSHGANHHDLALYDASLRPVLGHASDRSAMALGIRVANYRQLRNAVGHLRGRGAEPVQVPRELVPGFDYVEHLRDPEGNLVQLYYYLAQGDHAPPTVSGDSDNWPTVVEAHADTFGGEVYIGPWE